MDIALMIEGQNGLNWPRWQRLAEAVEQLGFVGLYRSDHFTNPRPPDLDSLELWTSLTWLASHTRRIEFGPLVAPVSFRNPVHMARTAAAIDDLSGGRLQLGLGAGWQEREHANYGFDLLPIPQRLARFQEALEVVSRLLNSEEPVTYEGTYYHLQDATLLPRPQRAGGPPIVIGGGRAILPMVVRYAAEWNVAFKPLDDVVKLSKRLDTLLEQQGRRPEEVRRTLMTRVIFGRTEQEVEQMISTAASGRSLEELRQAGVLAGTASAIVDQLGQLADIGMQRVMLQWIELDDLDRLAALAQGILPQL
ncbi:MAG: TIGR03560 family F420-dependent LLM class oxidoreductase [Ktedonobacteraceae bacterium]|nr:TIGR03560 family F420-dependent LLM class oxidoreductase [Ktedonobacteraceae bacterium]